MWLPRHAWRGRRKVFAMSSDERAIEPLGLDEREDKENGEVNNVAEVELGAKPKGPRRQEGIGEIGPCYAGYHIVHIRWGESKIEKSLGFRPFRSVVRGYCSFVML